MRTPAGRYGRLTRKRIGGGFAAIAAGVSFLVGVTSLIDFSEEKLESDEAPPAQIDARVTEVRLTTKGEPYQHYLRETNQSLAGLPNADRRERGLVFSARVRFKGGEGERFLLRLTMFRAGTGRPVPSYEFDVAEFSPGGPDHGREWPIWIPYPPHPGTFFARATVLDEKKQPVDEQDSTRFRVARVPHISS